MFIPKEQLLLKWDNFGLLPKLTNTHGTVTKADQYPRDCYQSWPIPTGLLPKLTNTHGTVTKADQYPRDCYQSWPIPTGLLPKLTNTHGTVTKANQYPRDCYQSWPIPTGLLPKLTNTHGTVTKANQYPRDCYQSWPIPTGLLPKLTNTQESCFNISATSTVSPYKEKASLQRRGAFLTMPYLWSFKVRSKPIAYNAISHPVLCGIFFLA